MEIESEWILPDDEFEALLEWLDEPDVPEDYVKFIARLERNLDKDQSS